MVALEAIRMVERLAQRAMMRPPAAEQQDKKKDRRSKRLPAGRIRVHDPDDLAEYVVQHAEDLPELRVVLAKTLGVTDDMRFRTHQAFERLMDTAVELADDDRWAASDRTRLAREALGYSGPLAGLRLAVLHGRLPADEKDRVMRSFADGGVEAGRERALFATQVVHAWQRAAFAQRDGEGIEARRDARRERGECLALGQFAGVAQHGLERHARAHEAVRIGEQAVGEREQPAVGARFSAQARDRRLCVGACAARERARIDGRRPPVPALRLSYHRSGLGVPRAGHVPLRPAHPR